MSHRSALAAEQSPMPQTPSDAAAAASLVPPVRSGAASLVPSPTPAKAQAFAADISSYFGGPAEPLAEDFVPANDVPLVTPSQAVTPMVDSSYDAFSAHFGDDAALDDDFFSIKPDPHQAPPQPPPQQSPIAIPEATEDNLRQTIAAIVSQHGAQVSRKKPSTQLYLLCGEVRMLNCGHTAELSRVLGVQISSKLTIE